MANKVPHTAAATHWRPHHTRWRRRPRRRRRHIARRQTTPLRAPPRRLQHGAATALISPLVIVVLRASAAWRPAVRAEAATLPRHETAPHRCLPQALHPSPHQHAVRRSPWPPSPVTGSGEIGRDLSPPPLVSPPAIDGHLPLQTTAPHHLCASCRIVGVSKRIEKEMQRRRESELGGRWRE